MRNLRHSALVLLLSAPALALAACSIDEAHDGAEGAVAESITGSQIVSALGNRCLDDDRALTTNGNKVQVWSCYGGVPQHWSLTGSSIVGPGGKCLDVRANQQVSGTTVWLYECNGTAAQRWTVTGKSIKSAGGLCLEVAGGVDANGTPVQIATCNGSQAQSWTVSGAPAPAPVPSPLPSGTSIRKYTTCDGVTDDAKGAAAAFAAAKNGAFTLLVDCPVRMHIGDDILRPIFVEDGTTVVFAPGGKFIIDNLFTPAFMLANTQNVTMTNWEVEWDGSMPIDPATGSYHRDGVLVQEPGGNGSGAFNDTVLTPWLTAHRGIVFDQSKGRVLSAWHGSVNNGAVFYLLGDTSNVHISGMSVHPIASAGGHQFVPFVFSFDSNFKSNQTVNATTPLTNQYFEVPHDLVLTDITLDGTYMGFQGSLHDAVIQRVHSKRYGDLQDASGGTVGGLGKYFPPPHLFYLNYGVTGDPSMFNRNIQMSDVTDDGIRVGVARDKGGSDTVSGYADSLKLGCHHCTVDRYTSHRPDGFMDTLSSDDLVVSNVVASYDSSFLHGVFPGWRWPQPPYSNVHFENVTLADTAATAAKAPMSNVGDSASSNIVFTNVKLSVNDWPGASILPTVNGSGVNSVLEFSMKSGPAKQLEAASRSVSFTLDASPTTLVVGASSTLTWSARGATGCVPSGSWSGSIGTSGSTAVSFATAGVHDVTLTCKNATDTASATVSVTVVP